MRKHFAWVFLLLATAFLFCACSDKDTALDSEKFYIYFQDSKGLGLYPVEANMDKEASLEDRVSSVWSMIYNGPEASKYVSPVPKGVNMNHFAMEGDDLIFSFDASYHEISPEEEILLRASVVKTYTQFFDVNTVEIRVEDQPLILQDGSVVTSQKSSDFVDLFGSGLNAFNEAELVLYYPVKTGEKLRKTLKTVNYRTSQPLEYIAAKLILQGPDDTEQLSASFPPEVKLLSVNTKNNVCSVNLGTQDVKGNVTVLPDMIVYSLVDTLTEINGISSVQIYTNGTNTNLFFDAVDISKPLYRDLDYVEEETTETENEPEGEKKNE